MSSIPLAKRPHIAFFGRRNAGKSSLVDALISRGKGLRPDPGATELPLGPVVLCDPMGLDEAGALDQTRRQLRLADLAVLVLDPVLGVGAPERDLLEQARLERVPVIAVANTSDLADLEPWLVAWQEALGLPVLAVSASSGRGLAELQDLIAETAAEEPPEPPLVADLVRPVDVVLLVMASDPEAQGGWRQPLALAMQEIVQRGATAVVVHEGGLAAALHRLGRPDLVLTDASIFGQVAAMLSWGVPLTSFSILLARQKGDLGRLVAGAHAITDLRPGDRVLVSEVCTGDRRCGDTGTELIPRRLEDLAGGKLRFTWTRDEGFPDDPRDYQLAGHCEGCMLSRRELMRRLSELAAADVPVANYGVLLAQVDGTLGRALEPLVCPRRPEEEPLVTWAPV